MKSMVVRALGLFASMIVAGLARAQSTAAVEWKANAGGNGHWYRLIDFGLLSTWTGAQQYAVACGANLATVGSASEQAFLVQLVQNQNTTQSCEGWGGVVWLGGRQRQAGLPSNQGWEWVTGEPWQFQNWASGEPNDYGNLAEDYLVFFGSSGLWNDIPGSPVSSPACVYGAMVEWSADCNGDGIVDYGQIRSGQLIDLNSNGIPDVCETSITGVQPVSGPSQGGTAINILGNNLPENPSVSIGGVAALNVVRLNANRITAVTPPNLPGVADVTVNNWTSQNAFYYRPECGSDLDQNGSVDAADIAIVLLDFGPCYVTATSPQADDSKPFMLQEQPAPAAPQSR